jgi:hypothetical protein
MVTTGAGMYFLQQLAALISEDAPHEYADSPTLVELAVDEEKKLLLGGRCAGLPSGRKGASPRQGTRGWGIASRDL